METDAAHHRLVPSTHCHALREWTRAEGEGLESLADSICKFFSVMDVHQEKPVAFAPNIFYP
jgi:hypothetical protein